MDYGKVPDFLAMSQTNKYTPIAFCDLTPTKTVFA